MRTAKFAFPLAWMGIIVWLASDSGSAERTGRLILPVLQALFPSATPLQLEAMHAIIRKLAHVTEYAILAALWTHALAGRHATMRARAAWLAWSIAAAWAVVDETFQSTVSSRTASAFDVALDTFGALVIALPVAVGWRRAADAVASVALWTSVVGGAALLVVNGATRVESGLLWLTVPAAAAVLLWRRRRARP